VDIATVDGTFQNLSNPGEKTRQFLPAKFIAGSANHHMPVFTEIEVRIAETPDVEAFGFAFRGNWLRLWDNDRFAQTWILTKIPPRITRMTQIEIRVIRAIRGSVLLEFALYEQGRVLRPRRHVALRESCEHACLLRAERPVSSKERLPVPESA